MKKILSLLSIPLLFTACASDDPTPASRSAASGQPQARADEDAPAPPRIGMSQQEVREKYGRPHTTSVNSSGEVWTYVFNMWDGRDFIPFYGSVHSSMRKRQVGTVIFDKNDRVRDFNWSQH